MLAEIITIQDVKFFAEKLRDEKVNFHPDDDFNSYIDFLTNEPLYSQTDAKLRNALMDQCFLVCEKENVDIYEIMINEFKL